MCECGCSFGNPTYRLPIDATSCYVIELYPGCSDCHSAPGIIVQRHNEESSWWETIEESPLFPLTAIDGFMEGAIKCGLEPLEFRKAVLAEIVGTEVDEGKIDEDLAEILADDIWGEAVQIMPEVIKYQAKD